VQVVESCLAISVVDFKGVTVKLLKLTGVCECVCVWGGGEGTQLQAHTQQHAQ